MPPLSSWLTLHTRFTQYIVASMYMAGRWQQRWAVAVQCSAVGSIWMVGRRAEAAKLTQPFQGMVSLGTGFLSGFFS